MLLKYLFLFTTIHYVHSTVSSPDWPHHFFAQRANSSGKVKRSVQTESQEKYVQNCIESEANLNKCVKDKINELLPAIEKGIPQFNLPTVFPYNFGTIEQQASPSLIFIYTGKAIPSKEAYCYMANLDVKHKWFQAGLEYKSVLFYGNFTLKGAIDNKPVLATGYANFTYGNPKFEYDSDWTGNTLHHTFKIKNSNLTLVKYDLFSNVLYQIKEVNAGSDESHSVSGLDDLGLYDLEPVINAAINKIGNPLFTLVSNVFCSLILY